MPGKGRALIVSVEKTKVLHKGAPLRPLTGVHTKADALEALLVQRAWSPVRLRDAKAQTILTALDDLVAAASVEDLILFYFCGHGLPFVTGIPGDLTDTQFAASDVTFDDNELRARWLGLAEGHRILSIVDTCHSETAFHAPLGSLVRKWAASWGLLSGPSCKVFSMPALRAKLVHFGASKDSFLASEGAFTQALLDGLRKPIPAATYRALFLEMAAQVSSEPRCWYLGVGADTFVDEVPLSP